MIFRRPKAVEAIIELAAYIGQSSPDSAERFMTAAENTFTDLERMPGMGHLHETNNPPTQQIRVWPVMGFRNHLIFYRPIQDGIEIITLLHGARNIASALPDEMP